MMWSPAISCFIAMFALASHVRGAKQLEPEVPKYPEGCLQVPDGLLWLLEDCKIEWSEQLNCVTAIKKCPKDCKDGSGRIYKRNEEWVEMVDEVTFDCACKLPIRWFRRLPTKLYKKFPPTGICNRRGCGRPRNRQMRYGETYYKEREGDRYKCTCIKGPDPQVADDSSHSHIKCQVVE